MNRIIAIDGLSGAGKGTLSRFLAESYHFKHLDTGLLYRFVAYQVLEKEAGETDPDLWVQMAQNCSLETLENPSVLRHERIAKTASLLSAHPGVRDSLTAMQRAFSKEDPAPYQGVILDGRDIGTVICPEAPCKIFLTAAAEERALRRFHDPQETSQESLSHITKMMAVRDQRDQERLISPLSPATDACIIDTTQLTIEDVCRLASAHVKRCFPGIVSKDSLPSHP